MDLRNEKKLSQQEVAEYLNITRQAYSRYERGEREANYETLDKLATFFDVSIDYLLGRTTYFYPDNLISNTATPIVTSFSPEEQEIIEQYRKLPKTSKELLLRMVGITKNENV